MAVINVGAAAGAAFPVTVNLATALGGNVDTTNIVDRGGRTGPALVQNVSAIGATPTCTYLISVSSDGTNWVPAVYADSATPTTLAFATWTETTAVTRWKLVRANDPWRYLKVTFSANTNVTNTTDVWIY